MSVSPEKLSHIRDLERKHVEVYYKLLETLDELYLVKQMNQNITLDAKQTSLLEMRRQMQFMVDKSVALFKTNERLNNMYNSGRKISEVNNEEDILALSLEKELQEGVNLDADVYRTYTENKELVHTLQQEMAKYSALTTRLQQLRPIRNGDNTSDSQESPQTNIHTSEVVREDTRLSNENEVLEQLLVALNVHTRGKKS